MWAGERLTKIQTTSRLDGRIENVQTFSTSFSSPSCPTIEVPTLLQFRCLLQPAESRALLWNGIQSTRARYVGILAVPPVPETIGSRTFAHHAGWTPAVRRRGWWTSENTLERHALEGASVLRATDVRLDAQYRVVCTGQPRTATCCRLSRHGRYGSTLCTMKASAVWTVVLPRTGDAVGVVAPKEAGNLVIA